LRKGHVLQVDKMMFGLKYLWHLDQGILIESEMSFRKLLERVQLIFLTEQRM